MKGKSTWRKSPWVISISTAVFGFLLTLLYDLFRERPILSTIYEFFVLIINGIISFLNFQLRVWWVLLGIALIVAILYIIFKVWDAFQKDTSSGAFLKYTSDTLSGWK